MSQSAASNAAPNISLAGYMGRRGIVKEEIRIALNSVGVSKSQFSEYIPNTRLNLQLIQMVSDYEGKVETFRNEKVKVESLTSEGDAVQFIRLKPTAENDNTQARWTEKLRVGFQLYKEATMIGETASHTNWYCLTRSVRDWVVPEAAIANRNGRRTVPPGFEIERFVSVSDSQKNRANAIVRRLIISPR